MLMTFTLKNRSTSLELPNVIITSLFCICSREFAQTISALQFTHRHCNTQHWQSQ